MGLEPVGGSSEGAAILGKDMEGIKDSLDSNFKEIAKKEVLSDVLFGYDEIAEHAIQNHAGKIAEEEEIEKKVIEGEATAVEYFRQPDLDDNLSGEKIEEKILTSEGVSMLTPTIISKGQSFNFNKTQFKNNLFEGTDIGSGDFKLAGLLVEVVGGGAGASAWGTSSGLNGWGGNGGDSYFWDIRTKGGSRGNDRKIESRHGGVEIGNSDDVVVIEKKEGGGGSGDSTSRLWGKESWGGWRERTFAGGNGGYARIWIPGTKIPNSCNAHAGGGGHTGMSHGFDADNGYVTIEPVVASSMPARNNNQSIGIGSGASTYYEKYYTKGVDITRLRASSGYYSWGRNSGSANCQLVGGGSKSVHHGGDGSTSKDIVNPAIAWKIKLSVDNDRESSSARAYFTGTEDAKGTRKSSPLPLSDDNIMSNDETADPP